MQLTKPFKHQVALKESAFKRALALKDTSLREAEAEVQNLYAAN